MSSGAGPDPWKIYRIRIQQNYADPSDPDPQQKFQVYSIQYIKHDVLCLYSAPLVLGVNGRQSDKKKAIVTVPVRTE